MNHSYDQEFKIANAISEAGMLLHSEQPLFVTVNNVGYRELRVVSGHKVTRNFILGCVPWWKFEPLAEIALQVFFCETRDYSFQASGFQGSVSPQSGTPVDPVYDVVRVTAHCSPPELGFYDGVSLAVKMVGGVVQVTVLDWGRLVRTTSGEPISQVDAEMGSSSHPLPAPASERDVLHSSV